MNPLYWLDRKRAADPVIDEYVFKPVVEITDGNISFYLFRWLQYSGILTVGIVTLTFFFLPKNYFVDFYVDQIFYVTSTWWPRLYWDYLYIVPTDPLFAIKFTVFNVAAALVVIINILIFSPILIIYLLKSKRPLSAYQSSTRVRLALWILLAVTSLLVFVLPTPFNGRRFPTSEWSLPPVAALWIGWQMALVALIGRMTKIAASTIGRS